MNEVYLSMLGQQLLAMDVKSADVFLIRYFKVQPLEVRIYAYNFILENIFYFSDIVSVRLMFKYGLSRQGCLQALDAEGNLVPIELCDIRFSLFAYSEHTFSFLCQGNEFYMLTWLQNSKIPMDYFFTWEVGIQALQVNDFILARLMAKYYSTLNLLPHFICSLLSDREGQVVLYYVPELLEYCNLNVVNTLINVGGKEIFMVELLLKTDYGKSLLFNSDDRLFYKLNLNSLMDASRHRGTNLLIDLMLHPDSFLILAQKNFYWLRQLDAEKFSQVFDHLLSLEHFNFYDFAKEMPMVLIMLALFPAGRRWLGLPGADAGEDPILTYLNHNIEAGRFHLQSIGLWMVQSYESLMFLKIYGHQLVLSPKIKRHLSEFGEDGKIILMEASRHQKQYDLTARFGFFNQYVTCEDNQEPTCNVGAVRTA